MTCVKCGSAIVLLCGMLAFGQVKSDLKVDVDLVLLQAAVTDGNSRYVAGLKREDFQVWEDKIQQEVEFFSAENAPASVAIIFDVSGSMENKLKYARAAAATFLNMGDPDDEYMLIEFSDSPRLVQDFTKDITKLQSRLLFSGAKGSTSLYDALYLGLEKVRRAGNSRKAMLVITDGQDNHSRYSLADVKNLAREHDVMIYTIGIEDRVDLEIGGVMGRAVLKGLAQMTGGMSFFPGSAEALPAICEQIGIDLKNQYVLGYRPQNLAKDGKWRKIRVKVGGEKKATTVSVRAKTGYYAPTLRSKM